MDVVQKPFNSPTRRFRPSTDPTKPAIVTAEDVSPLDFAHLKGRGFIGAPASTEPPPSPGVIGKADKK